MGWKWPTSPVVGSWILDLNKWAAVELATINAITSQHGRTLGKLVWDTYFARLDTKSYGMPHSVELLTKDTGRFINWSSLERGPSVTRSSTCVPGMGILPNAGTVDHLASIW